MMMTVTTYEIDQGWMRRRRYRPVARHHVWSGSIYVGHMVTVTDQEYAGLIAMVLVEKSIRGQGWGVPLHAAVQRHIGIPLLLDTAGPDIQDHVQPCEIAVWSSMGRRTEWRIGKRPDGIYTAMTLTL